MDSFAGIKQKGAGYSFHTASYEQYQAICITSGRLTATVREVDTPLGPGAVLHLPAGSAFSLWCDRTQYEGVFVVLDPPLPSRFHGQAQSLVAPPALQQIVTLIQHESQQMPPGADRVIRALGTALAELVVRLSLREGGGEPQEANRAYWAERVRERIELNLYSERTMGEILSGLALGPRQLARHFRCTMGMTPKQYHLHRRLEQGMRLICGSALSVTSVAMELGFPSPQHFATQFRRIYGISPTQARTGAQRSAAGQAGGAAKT